MEHVSLGLSLAALMIGRADSAVQWLEPLVGLEEVAVALSQTSVRRCFRRLYSRARPGADHHRPRACRHGRGVAPVRYRGVRPALGPFVWPHG